MREADDSPPIVWDQSNLGGGVARARPVLIEPTTLGRLLIRVSTLVRTLSVRSCDRQLCDGPMETTRRPPTSAPAAVDVLDHVGSVDWRSSVDSGCLRLQPFRPAPGEPGNPWIAAGVLSGRRTRRLDVSVAIFSDGPDRCGVEIRPLYHRPWSRRRLRRCLSSTHCAADRLRDVVSTSTASHWTTYGWQRTVTVPIGSSPSS